MLLLTAPCRLEAVIPLLQQMDSVVRGHGLCGADVCLRLVGRAGDLLHHLLPVWLRGLQQA